MRELRLVNRTCGFFLAKKEHAVKRAHGSVRTEPAVGDNVMCVDQNFPELVGIVPTGEADHCNSIKLLSLFSTARKECVVFQMTKPRTLCNIEGGIDVCADLRNSCPVDDAKGFRWTPNEMPSLPTIRVPRVLDIGGFPVEGESI